MTDLQSLLSRIEDLEVCASPPEWWTSEADGSIQCDMPISKSGRVGDMDLSAPDEALVLALRNSAPLLLKLARLAVEARDAVLIQEAADGNMNALDWLARYDAITKEATDAR